jgi:hypothetical protein
MPTHDHIVESKFRKSARINNRATGRFTELYEFPVSESNVAQIEIAPSKAHDSRQFGVVLRDNGAMLPKDEKDCRRLLRLLANSKAPEEWIYAAETGWLNGRWNAFVQVGGVIGESPKKIIGVSLAGDALDPVGQVTKKGTWKSWKCIAEHARLSFRLSRAIAGSQVTSTKCAA